MSPAPEPQGASQIASLLQSFDALIEADRAGQLPELHSNQLARLLQISNAISRIHDRRQLLSYVTDRLRELFDAQNSFVVLLDEDGSPHIESAHCQGLEPQSSPISLTILDRVCQAKEPLLIQDCSDDLELRDQSSIKRLKITSVLCAPLKVDDRVIGVIQFDHRSEPHPFPRSDFELLRLFADLVAIAFRNIELIESLREARLQVIRQERLSALGEMAAGIAHNFNNLLFVALGMCDVLLTKDEVTGFHAEVEKIRECALDAAAIIKRVEWFARGGQPDSERELVDLRALAADMPVFTRHKWRDEAHRRGASIEMKTALRKVPLVWGNAVHIREILTNLVFNAADAIEGSGTITLSTGRRASGVFVSVKDTGCGMDEATRKKVFEPLFTTKPRGLGLGLSTCWKLAASLGGELRVASTPGRGSTFTLELPEAAAQEAVASPSEDAGGMGAARLLVIDDDPKVLDLMERLLTGLGHQIIKCSSAEAGLSAFRASTVDVVVTDLGMPDCNGTQFVRRLRELDPTVPVLLLTGWGASVEVDPMVRDQISCILPKPIALSTLRAEIDRVLRAGPRAAAAPHQDR